MRQLSSSWTLAFRIFFPTLWITFFGTFLVSVLFTQKSQLGGLSTTNLGIGLAIFMAIFIFIFYKTVFRLKRVDADKNHVYITNFFKHVRYKHEYVKKIDISRGVLFYYGKLILIEKAAFGDQIPFLLSKKRLELFLTENPELRHWIDDK